MNRNLIIGIIFAVVITIIAIIVLFVAIPLSQSHNPETISWLNQAECNELLDWINERKGTLEKYQSTAKGIYDYKECGMEVSSITNFEECIAAGNPSMESHPRQCRTDD